MRDELYGVSLARWNLGVGIGFAHQATGSRQPTCRLITDELPGSPPWNDRLGTIGLVRGRLGDREERCTRQDSSLRPPVPRWTSRSVDSHGADGARGHFLFAAQVQQRGHRSLARRIAHTGDPRIGQPEARCCQSSRNAFFACRSRRPCLQARAQSAGDSAQASACSGGKSFSHALSMKSPSRISNSRFARSRRPPRQANQARRLWAKASAG